MSVTKNGWILHCKKFLVSSESQAYWNAQTGYFPVNVNAQNEDVFKENIEKYPQFQTALDQLYDSAPQYAAAEMEFQNFRKKLFSISEKRNIIYAKHTNYKCFAR